MVNLSVLDTTLTDLFVVLGTLITGIVNLVTGDLLVLTIVVAFIGLFVGIIYALLSYVKKATNGSFNGKMK